MNASEARAASVLVGSTAAGIAGMVEGVQHAVSQRVRRATAASLGAAALPVHALTDVVTTGVHTTVRAGLRLAATGIGVVAAQRAGGTSAHDATSPRSAGAVAALNGAAGGMLAETANPWAIELTSRIEGPVTPRVAVLVHGLGESPTSWRHDPDYRALLAELGWTPVLVRFNTGRRVWDSGTDLAAELSRVVAQWPVTVTEVALIGHSMGGLVARAAVHEAEGHEYGWLPLTSRLITLGTPHEGAPLARLGHLARGVLAKLPETKPFGTLIDYARAPGIDDLRAGTVGDAPHRPLPGHIRVCTLGVTLHRDASHPVSRALGDLLVTVGSATSTLSGRRADEDAVHIGGLHHFDLLGHPEVAATLRTWMA